MATDPTDPAWKRAKKRNARYIEEWEADERLSLTVQRRRARLGFASKVANGSPRRDVLEDRNILLVLQGLAKAKKAIGFRSGRRSAVVKEAAPIKEIKPGEPEEQTVHRVWVPDWTHTGDRLKTIAMGGVLLERGCSSLNMNPSEKIIQAALASPRGFVGYMTDRITRSLKRHMGSAPAFFFLVEGSPLHSLHLHGMIEMPTPDAKAAIRAALLDACGGGVARGYERAVRTAPVDVTPVSHPAITRVLG